MTLNKSEKRFRKFLVSLAFVLFSVFIIGLFWLATTPELTVSVALSYAAGLSMIVLPCTLPLVFIIVPLSMGKGYKKGFMIAVSFSIGLIIMLSIYGVVVSIIGKFLGLDQATRIMFTVAGLAALIFGLSELKILRFTLLGFSGTQPEIITRQQEYVKAFLLGLFLGNAGVGCPNPAFYVLLIYIASVGSVFTGGVLGFIHGLGRATPLIFLSILAILGVNAAGGIAKRRESITRITGWALVFIGVFILLYGVYGMYWWEDSIFHAAQNKLVYDIAPQLAEQPDHPIAGGLFVAPFWAGWLTLIILIFIPIIYYRIKYGMSAKWFSVAVLILLLLLGLLVTGNLQTEHAHGVAAENEVHIHEGGEEHIHSNNIKEADIYDNP